MRSPAFYRAKAAEWRTWLAENPDAKPGHRRTAEELAAAYEYVIPAAEEAFTRLQAVGPAESSETTPEKVRQKATRGPQKARRAVAPPGAHRSDVRSRNRVRNRRAK